MTEMMTPVELVRDTARSHPTRRAVLLAKSSLTYAELQLVSSQLAQVMRRRGVVPGDIFAVNVSTLWRCVTSIAVSHEAAVMVPLSPALLVDDHLGIAWYVVERPLIGIPLDRQFIINKEMLSRLKSIRVTVAPRSYASPDSLARIAMSSGTTGVPKAVPFSVRHNHVRALESVNRWATDGPFLSLMPPINGTGWNAWHASLVRQQPYMPPADAVTNVRMMEAYGVTAVMGSPPQLAVLAQGLELTGVKLPSLQVIQSGGSRLTPALVAEIRRLTGLDIGNAYSSTELGTVAFRMEHSDDPSYMGALASHADVQIVDPATDEQMPDGEMGSIRVRRPDMVTEYVNNPDATAAHFRDGWFYGGDLGKIVGSDLFLGARESEMINAGGVKVDPNLVDEAVNAQPDILDAATFTFVDEFEIGSVAVAFVLKPGGDADAVWAEVSSLIGHLAPARHFAVDSIPRNQWGKVTRQTLTEHFSEKPKA